MALPKKKLDLRFNEVHENIRTMCEGLKTLSESGLKEDLLVLMLHDTTGVTKTDIRCILKALPLLEKRYLK
jgi:hypothetical protein